MIFSYLKYVSPVWYFNLKPKVDHNYFPSKDELEEFDFKLEYDFQYETKEAQFRDLAYRAFQQGYISQKKSNENRGFWDTPKLPACDEYRFLLKNFNKVWVLYVLFLRVLSFKNPFKELKGILKAKSATRQSHHLKAFKYRDFDSFESKLIKELPKVSVIIPTLNRYEYLKDVFRDLEKQSYKNFEVIVVDQTDPYDASVYEGWNLDLKYWYQEEKALWKARNEAIEVAKGDFILLYDDDSLVEPNWIENHLKALDYFQADISSGVSLSTVGAEVPLHYSYFRWSDQLDTGNVLIKKHVFETIGLFDTKFEKQRMGDGEYGLRAYLHGYRNISNPISKRIHLKVGQGGLRQMGSWDGWRPKKFFGPRPISSILYFFRKYYGNNAAKWSLLKNVPPSIIPYQFKGSKLLIVLGFFISVLLIPVISLQVYYSWRLSSRMLMDSKENQLLNG